MGALLFSFSMKESSPHRPLLQGSTLHFLNEGVDGGSTLQFLNEGVDDGGSTLQFLNEGVEDLGERTRGSMEDLERGPYNPQRQRLKIIDN